MHFLFYVLIIIVVLFILYAVARQSNKRNVDESWIQLKSWFYDKKSPFYQWNIKELPGPIIIHWRVIFNKRVKAAYKVYDNNLCPYCNGGDSKSNKNNCLVLIHYKSPPHTWRNLAGREGDLIICTLHKKQIYFDCQVIS
jgi:hypothetical protein